MCFLADPSKRRWFGWSALIGGVVLANLLRLSTGVLSENLMSTFDITGTQLGVLHASFFYVYAFLQLPAGAATDRYGVRMIATGGILLMSVGTVGFAISNSFFLSVVARTLIGIGASVTFVSTLRFAANWYRYEEFATMNGLTIAGFGFGAVLATTPLAAALETFDWRLMMAGFGLYGLFVTGMVFIFVRDRPKNQSLQQFGTIPSQTNVKFSQVRDNIRTILKERETWLLGLMMFTIAGTNLTVLGLWGIPYLVHIYGFSVTRASTYVFLGSLGWIVGPIVIGWLSDRFRKRLEIIILSGGIYTIAYAMLAIFVNPPHALVGIVFFLSGFLIGGFILSYPVIKERHVTSASGVATGTLNGLATLGGAVFPAVLGAVLDAFWTGEIVSGVRVYTSLGYRIGFSIATLNGLVALGCAIWYYRDARKPKSSM